MSLRVASASAAAITFELGEADHHVPSKNARAFLSQVQQLDPAAGGRIRVQTYPGLDHLAVTTNDAPLTAAADWLTAQDPSRRQETWRINATASSPNSVSLRPASLRWWAR